MVCAIAEGDVDDTVRSDLGYTGDAPGLEVLAQAGDEGRRGGRCGAGVLCDMGAEAGVDD